MGFNSRLTHEHQTDRQRFAPSHSIRATDSPSAPTAASTRHRSPSVLSQQSPTSDIFDRLVFDRQRVYQTRSTASFALRSNPNGVEKRLPITPLTGELGHGNSPNFHTTTYEEKPSDHGDASLLKHLNDPMAARTTAGSRARKPQTKKTSAKRKGKTTDEKPDRRPITQPKSPRPMKVRKTAANSKKTLVNKTVGTHPRHAMSEGSLVGTDSKKFIIISDDEDDGGFGGGTMDTARKNHTVQLPSAQRTSPSDAIKQEDSERSESDTHPESIPENLQSDMTRMQIEYTQQIQQLRQEVDAAKAERDEIRGQMEQKMHDKEVLYFQAETRARSQYTALQNELESTEESVRIVAAERDQLRIDIDNREARNNQLQKELENEKRVLEQAKKEHATIAEDIMKSRDIKSHTPPRPGTDEYPKTGFSSINRLPLSPASLFVPSNRATLSPAPSSPSCEEEGKKLENVRNTYMKVKRRFDLLRSVSINLVSCTKSMDLSSFGEFGSYLRQLKMALELDGDEKQGLGRG